jgi:hypothetical protein
MHRTICLPVLAALALAIAPRPAASADAPQPKTLRTLVYDVTYAAHTAHEMKTSGFNGAYGNPGENPSASGSGTAGVGLDGSDSGRLTIDVVAATADGGLVVDAAYTGRLHNQPTMRVAIFPDGRLSAAPGKTIGPEALHLLPLLARGFVANRAIETGATWTVNAPPPARGATTYRVSGMNGQAATIALEGSLSVSGIGGFDESDTGTTTYATDLLSPIAYDLNARIRRQIGVEESTTTTLHMVATLVSDTFAKKPS